MGLRPFTHSGVKLKGSGEISGNSVPLSIDIGAARHGQFIAFAIFEGVADRFAAGAAVRTGIGAVHFFVAQETFFIQRQFYLGFVVPIGPLTVAE